jgi:integrase
VIKGKLTVKKVARAKPGRHGDGAGLYLEAGENSASWLLRWERDGRERWHGLGSARDVSLDEARELAREARRLIKGGGDPVEQKRAERAAMAAAKAKVKTFGECATIYFNDRRDGWHPAHALQWSSTVLGRLLDGQPVKADYCEPLRNLPVQMIDVPLVLSIIQPIWRIKPTTADRVRNRIEATLDWASAAGLRSGDNPAALKTIGKLLPKLGREQTNYAAVPYRELPAVFVNLRALPGTPARALEFAVLCAARSNEVLEALWPEIDWHDRVWIIPRERMKGGIDHRVPLSPQALELLRALPREDGHSYVFVSSRPGRPLARNSLRRVMKRLGRRETSHGTARASFSTWASERTRFERPVIEGALAHAISDEVEAAYKRNDGGSYLLDKRRELLDHWAAFLHTPPVDMPDKVVLIRTGATR